jgi:hypothetical protein
VGGWKRWSLNSEVVNMGGFAGGGAEADGCGRMRRDRH